mgnify:CR=1 FL=1
MQVASKLHLVTSVQAIGFDRDAQNCSARQQSRAGIGGSDLSNEARDAATRRGSITARHAPQSLTCRPGMLRATARDSRAVSSRQLPAWVALLFPATGRAGSALWGAGAFLDRTAPRKIAVAAIDRERKSRARCETASQPPSTRTSRAGMGAQSLSGRRPAPFRRSV